MQITVSDNHDYESDPLKTEVVRLCIQKTIGAVGNMISLYISISDDHCIIEILAPDTKTPLNINQIEDIWEPVSKYEMSYSVSKRCPV